MINPPLPTLTYFASRGLAEPIRLLLAEAGVSYQERSLGTWSADGPTPEFQDLLDRGRLPFGSVPLWEEVGGFAVVQSDAILRHLARTRGLYGVTVQDAARCDMVRESVKDAQASLRTVLPEGRSAAWKKVEEVLLPRHLSAWERWLEREGGTHPWFVLPQPTVADVVMGAFLETLEDNDLGAVFHLHPRLSSFYMAWGNRPGIASHRSRPERHAPQTLPRAPIPH